MATTGLLQTAGITVSVLVVLVGCTAGSETGPTPSDAATAPTSGPEPSSSGIVGSPTPSETPAAVEFVPGPFPPTLVVVFEDGRVVEIDATSGEELRTIVVIPPRDLGEGTPSSISAVLRDLDGNVYVDVCCEPAAGRIRVFDPEGAELDGIMGYDADIDDAGAQLFANSSDCITVHVTLPERENRLIGLGGHPDVDCTYLSHPRFSPGGDRLVGADWHAGDLRVRAVAAETALDDRVLRPPAFTRWRTPEWRADGRLLAVEHHETGDGPAFDWVGVLVDAQTGERLGEWDIAGEVASMDYDPSRTWLLITHADGSLQWQGGGESDWLFQSGVVSADW